MSLSKEIISGTKEGVAHLIQAGARVDGHDEYGYTPLIQAAIDDKNDIAMLLLQHGALVDEEDLMGRTALYWAVEHNNIPLVKELLARKSNPNAYSAAGQPVIVNAILREDDELSSMLFTAGASQRFARDYINAKLLGHLFELVGEVDIINANGHFIPLDFEGFFLEFTLGAIRRSIRTYLTSYSRHKLQQDLSDQLKIITRAYDVAFALRKYKRHNIDIGNYSSQIAQLLNEQEFLIIPVSYQGHAITFIRYGNLWAKCDRGVDDSTSETVVISQITNIKGLSYDFLEHLMFGKNHAKFVKSEVNRILGLRPITSIPTKSQVSGNCSWANVEACIPAGLFMLLLEQSDNLEKTKRDVMVYYNSWLNWERNFSISEIEADFAIASPPRKGAIAALLGAVLFQRCNPLNSQDVSRARRILKMLTVRRYSYVLRNYISVFSKGSARGKEATSFFRLLDACGVNVREYL